MKAINHHSILEAAADSIGEHCATKVGFIILHRSWSAPLHSCRNARSGSIVAALLEGR